MCTADCTIDCNITTLTMAVSHNCWLQPVDHMPSSKHCIKCCLL